MNVIAHVKGYFDLLSYILYYVLNISNYKKFVIMIYSVFLSESSTCNKIEPPSFKNCMQSKVCILLVIFPVFNSFFPFFPKI